MCIDATATVSITAETRPIWRPEPRSRPGILLMFLVLWLWLELGNLGLIYQQNSERYTHIFTHAGPSGVRANTVWCHPPRGNPLWWDLTWKGWTILFSSREWLTQVTHAAVPVYSGLPSWIVDPPTRASIGRYGQPVRLEWRRYKLEIVISQSCIAILSLF